MSHTLTIKGQVTIPKRVREHLRLRPGDEVEFTIRAGGDVVVEALTNEDRRRAYVRGLERVRGTWKGPPGEEWLIATRGPPDETGA